MNDLCRRGKTVALLLLLGCLVAGEGPAAAGLLARVEPSWSPFYRVPAPAEVANLAAESRELLVSNPARVLQILTRARPREGAAARLLQGLKADAGYQLGGDALVEALRLYRALAVASPAAAEQAWAQFMGGTIQQGQGLAQEAGASLARALAGVPGPWTPALEFDLAVLHLEAERYREAEAGFSAWIERYPAAPGHPLVLSLAAECAARGREPERALGLFAEAQRADPGAWTVRPATGDVLADLLLSRGRVDEAVQLLETLAAAVPGGEAAGMALLRVGAIWTEQQRVAAAARAYGRLLDLGTTPAAAREARLRLALLGVDHADQVELTEPYPAYRLFYRPRPTLEEFAGGREPLLAQRALQGLATLEQRAGHTAAVLAVLAKVFQSYPESRESGRAYERYMELLEAHFTEQLRLGRALGVIEQYLVARAAMAWAPTRDIGSVLLLAARAYELLGAPGEARGVYERARDAGTRALPPPQLEQRILYTRVLERDTEALRSWVAGHPGERAAHLKLARALVRQEKPDEAKGFFQRAEKLSRTPAERLQARAQAQRLDAATAPAAVLLSELQGRRPLWEGLADPAAQGAWQASEGLTAARLAFATGAFAGASQALALVGARSAADTYLLAVSRLRQGHGAEAQALFEGVAAGNDPVYRDLAAQRWRGVELARQAEGVL